MSAEFYIRFKEHSWYEHHLADLREMLRNLPTYLKEVDEVEYWLRGSEEGKNSKDDWLFDVRIFFRPHDILMEVSTHPSSIERDIGNFTRAISAKTHVDIVDDDGEAANF